jgi:sterol 3beta-glucosyltransferase
MKIPIFTYGSRGDFEPFLALAVGLQKAGHTVTLAGPYRFAEFAARYQVSFMPLAGDPEEVSRLINDAGVNPFRQAQIIRDFVFSVTAEVSRASFAAAADADLLIHSFLFTTGMHSWAREHRLPDLSVQIFPVFASTRAFPNPAFAQVPPGPFSYLTHWLTEQIMWYVGNSGYQPALTAHPEISYPTKLYWPFQESPDRLRTPLLFAYSPSVLPRPVEWGTEVHVTGYFFLDDESYQPPAALSRFLEAGPPPVCVTFGSMINRQAEQIHRVVVDALAQSRQRAIFLTGWGNWNAASTAENILYLDAVPHSWLLPRCQLVIHHGGAGTTAAGLRAGIPNIVIPHTADQPFWGQRVQALGAGPAPIPIKKLAVERLLTALAETGNPSVLAAAEAVGRLIRSENGVNAAIRLVEATKARFSLKNHNL